MYLHHYVNTYVLVCIYYLFDRNSRTVSPISIKLGRKCSTHNSKVSGILSSQELGIDICEMQSRYKVALTRTGSVQIFKLK